MSFLEVVVAMGLLIPTSALVFQLGFQSMNDKLRAEAITTASRLTPFLESFMRQKLSSFWTTAAGDCVGAKPHFDLQSMPVVANFANFEVESFDVNRQLPTGLSSDSELINAYNRCRTQQTFISAVDFSSYRTMKFCLHIKPVGASTVFINEFSFIEVDYFMLDLRSETSLTCSGFVDPLNLDSRLGRFRYRSFIFARSTRPDQALVISRRGVFDATP